MRAGKGGRFGRERTEVISVSLRPASIYLLNQLAAEHGGAGRAIQIAVEFLSVRKKSIKLQDEPNDEAHQPFSFAVFPRTKNLIDRLALRYYDRSRGDVIRACIQQLYEMQELTIADLYGPKD